MNDDLSCLVIGLSKLTEADCAVVLIGSAARGCQTEQSDIDILVVATEKITKVPTVSPYHIKFSTEADFLRRLNSGEDFESWCVRYGVTLLDRGVWARIKSSLGSIWPRWEAKVVHGARRLLLASQLVEIGDQLAAREEIVLALGHITRGLLLKAGKFPLSRPELAMQARGIGYAHLADLHERLRNSDSPSASELAIGLRYSKKLLIHLDRTIYGRIAQGYAKAVRSKEARLAQLKVAQAKRP